MTRTIFESIITTIIIIAFWGLLLYLAGSFSNASFNIKEWGHISLEIIAALWMIGNVFIIPFVLIACLTKNIGI